MRAMREIDGYITLETSLVFPIVLFVIFVLYTFFFSMLNLGIINGILECECGKTAASVLTMADPASGSFSYGKLTGRDLFYLLHPDTKEHEKQLETAIRKAVSKKMMMGKINSLDVKVSGDRITAKIVVDTSIPILGSVQTAGFRIFRIHWKQTTDIFFEAEQIRRWSILEKSAD